MLRSKARKSMTLFVLIAAGLEGGGADTVFVCALNDDVDFPDENMSDFDFWAWVREHNNRLLVLPVDAKFCGRNNVRYSGNLSLHDQGFIYTWSHCTKRDNDHYNIVAALVEGVPNHLAIVPRAIWGAGNESYGMLASESGPLWLALFMVHFDDMEQAIQNLAAATLSEPRAPVWYVNPTNGLCFEGWRPEKTSHPPIWPVSGSASRRDATRLIRFFDDLKAADPSIKVFFNRDQPWIHDFHIGLPGLGMVRIEHKYRNKPWKQMVVNWAAKRHTRQAPFVLRRLYHFFIGQTRDGGITCIGRHEMHRVFSNTDRTAIDLEFVTSRTKTSLPEILEYMKQNFFAAKTAIIDALDDIRPEDITRGLLEGCWKQKMEQVLNRELADINDTGRQFGMPWVARGIQYWCWRLERSALFPVATLGSPFTHLYIDHKWLPDELSYYQKYGRLPFYVWCKAIMENRAVALKLEDRRLGPHASLQLDALLGQTCSGWNKPPGEDFKCFNVFGMLKSSIVRQNQERSAWYACFPDDITARFQSSDESDRLSKIEPAMNSTGEKFLRARNAYSDTLQDPPYRSGKTAVPLKAPFILEGIEPMRYLMNVADGSINRQLNRVLDDDLMNKSFEWQSTQGVSQAYSPKIHIGQYIRTVRAWMQSLWTYSMAYGVTVHRGGETSALPKLRPNSMMSINRVLFGEHDGSAARRSSLQVMTLMPSKVHCCKLVEICCAFCCALVKLTSVPMESSMPKKPGRWATYYYCRFEQFLEEVRRLDMADQPLNGRLMAAALTTLGKAGYRRQREHETAQVDGLIILSVIGHDIDQVKSVRAMEFSPENVDMIDRLEAALRQVHGKSCFRKSPSALTRPTIDTLKGILQGDIERRYGTSISTSSSSSSLTPTPTGPKRSAEQANMDQIAFPVRKRQRTSGAVQSKNPEEVNVENEISSASTAQDREELMLDADDEHGDSVADDEEDDLEADDE
ncbi:uncharacterized protein MYCFIDRAFT_180381 [Pseudocercospora fijiensis CIRAD86]|uniref:Uncharacterized protein n=1 Tax=Pseudocercospora fijiensis (strain CIRAD86) TaxID=383855 RepID=M2ZD48_PSEFD|nr:uncharacterized protein MYCFIDRAFT_180381 [Pseudocercospora fijiensis CIRAD86]EME77049.1 hypothetical protein MYCFIDRAFT_180381 [Pseudocercospora fijiensis CIRAD86]